MALDQILFEVEGLDLGPGDDDLDVGDLLRQSSDGGAAVGGLEVRAHARPQGLGLSDVEDTAFSVPEEVHARLRGQVFQFAFQSSGHVSSVALAFSGAPLAKEASERRAARTPTGTCKRRERCILPPAASGLRAQSGFAARKPKADQKRNTGRTKKVD